MKIEQVESQQFATVNDALYAVMNKITGTRTVIGQTFNPAKNGRLNSILLLLTVNMGSEAIITLLLMLFLTMEDIKWIYERLIFIVERI